MRRREFITLVGGAVGSPLTAAWAQQPMPVIGFVNTGSPEAFARPVQAFRGGLTETGYIEGQNVTIGYRWAYGQSDRLAEMAGDLVRRQVSVIAATGGSPAPKAATIAIPIVFQIGVDPVDVGLVASLNRPGSNITG